MKVAIIGGGICGLYLGKKLVDSGHQVEVFEQKTAIGKECCSGLFSERLFDFIPESRRLAENKINRCLIHFPRKTVTLEFNRRFFVIEHARLDQLAEKQAEAGGVKVTLGLKIGKDLFNDLTDKFDRVIACDGALSKTRDRLGLKKPKLYLGIQGFLEKENSSDFVETWATKNGFIWKIPRGTSEEYGIMEEPPEAMNIFGDFRKKNNLSFAGIKSAPIPQGFALPRNATVTLCGDASGLIKPWSGGGVVWGLKEADILLKNFPDFVKYKNEAERYYGTEIAVASLIKKAVYWLGFNLPFLIPNAKRIDGDYLFK
jgi:flavin-dependent dehydrogenase